MRRRISDAAAAGEALEYFNGFHDAFLQQLTLRSHDRFEARGVQAMSGRLDLELVFAHYNYREGEPPADQLVRAWFREVAGVVLDLPGRPEEWSIDRLEIEPRPPLLAVRVHQHCLREGAWTTCEALRFTFREAEFDELFG